MSDRILRSTNVPAQFSETTLDQYDVDRGDAYALDVIDRWRPTRKEPGLLLQGPPNRAKTMIASALLNESQGHFHCKTPGLPFMVMKQAKLPVYFIQLAEYIDLNIRTFKLHDLLMNGHITDATEYLEIDQLLQDLKERVQVLVIDDVGKEHRTASGYAEDQFDLLVRTRHNNSLPTIYTTNVPLPKWGMHYSESMQSIIGRSSTVVKFH
jgi:DNA replication protein DnaC